MKKELDIEAIRLKQFRKHLKLSQKKFGTPIGSNQSSISDVERGKVGITSDLLKALIKIHRLNPLFLFFGKPPMQIPEFELEDKIGIDDNDGIIPLSKANLVIPIDLQAAYIEAVKTGKWDSEQMAKASFARLPGISGDIRTFQISSDSMLPSFMNGDYICCKKMIGITAARDNGLYLIVTEEHGLTLARLAFSDRKKTVQLNFENSESGGSLQIPYNKVMEIWEVQLRLTGVFNMPFERRLKNLEEKLLPPPVA